MKDLNIATGLQEYNFNGKCTVYFNPTDPNFIDKVFTSFSDLDQKNEEYRNQVQKETDGAKVLEIAKAMDAEMRDMIDDVFGTEVCAPLFGNISVYASADGLPLWANLMLAVIDEMDDAFAREKKASNPRIKKYTDKFKKAR